MPDPILHLLFKRSTMPFPDVREYKRYQISFLPLAARLERKTYLQAIRIYHQAHQVFLQHNDANQMVSNCCSQDSGWLHYLVWIIASWKREKTQTQTQCWSWIPPPLHPCVLRKAGPPHPQKRWWQPRAHRKTPRASIWNQWNQAWLQLWKGTWYPLVRSEVWGWGLSHWIRQKFLAHLEEVGWGRVSSKTEHEQYQSWRFPRLPSQLALALGLEYIFLWGLFLLIFATY